MPSAVLKGKISEEKQEKAKETEEKLTKDEPLEKRIATEQGKRIVIVSPSAIVNGFLAAESQKLLINPRIEIIRYARLVNPPYIDIQKQEETAPTPFFTIDFGTLISHCGFPIEFNEYKEWAKAHKVPCLIPTKKIERELGEPELKERANHIYDLLEVASVRAIQHDLRKATRYNFNSLQAFRLF